MVRGAVLAQPPPALLAAAWGACGKRGEIRRGIRLFQSRSLPLHNVLCKGAWGTGDGLFVGFFWMGGGINLCLPEGTGFDPRCNELNREGRGAEESQHHWGSRALVPPVSPLLLLSCPALEQKFCAKAGAAASSLPARAASFARRPPARRGRRRAGAGGVWEPRGARGASAEVSGCRCERN